MPNIVWLEHVATTSKFNSKILAPKNFAKQLNTRQVALHASQSLKTTYLSMGSILATAIINNNDNNIK